MVTQVHRQPAAPPKVRTGSPSVLGYEEPDGPTRAGDAPVTKARAPRVSGRANKPSPARARAAAVATAAKVTPGGPGSTTRAGREPRQKQPDQVAGGHLLLSADPRFRARWVDVRRQEGHRRLRAVLAIGAVLAAVVGGVGAAYSPLLAVRHVRIRATAHVPAAQVLAVTGLGRHGAMIAVRPASEAARLGALAWVASAEVTRRWPSTVVVSLQERRPVVQVAASRSPEASQTSQVDATGRVLTSPAAPIAGLPTLVNAPAPGPPGSRLAQMPSSAELRGSLREGLLVAEAIPPSVALKVRSIAVDDAGAVNLTLAAGATTVGFGLVALPGEPVAGAAIAGPAGVPIALSRQVAALATLLSTVDLTKVGQVDLTVPDRPALTPAQPPTIVSTTSRG